MHDIEPFFLWRDYYRSETDPDSPFYGRRYSEFEFDQKIYNYLIHPQWDHFGSRTLYAKLIMVDDALEFAAIELLGEWNDAIENDVMNLKRMVIDPLLTRGIKHFVLLGEHVLNFHSSDDCYYEEWYQEVQEQHGWIVALQFRNHVWDEMDSVGIGNYLYSSHALDQIPWRRMNPSHFFTALQNTLGSHLY